MLISTDSMHSGLVVLDEAHAAHVGGEVVDHRAHPSRAARAGVAKVAGQPQVLDVVEALVPLVERLDVDRADLGVATLLQNADQMAADEAAGAGDNHKIILGH